MSKQNETKQNPIKITNEDITKPTPNIMIDKEIC